MSTEVRKCDACGYTTLNSTICHKCGGKLGFFADYLSTETTAAANKGLVFTKVKAHYSAEALMGTPIGVPTGIEAQVCADIAKRQQLGISKYGVTVAENPLDLLQWLQHAYEECLDQGVYLKRAMEELKASIYTHGRMDKDGTQANS